MVLILSCCNNDNDIVKEIGDPFQEADDYSVTLLLVDAKNRNILDPSLMGSQYNYKAIYNSSVELVTPKLDGAEIISVEAPYIDPDDAEKIPYLHIRAGRKLNKSDTKCYESEQIIYSEYIFHDKNPHYIKVIHEPIYLRQQTVWIDGVAYPSISRKSVSIEFFYSTYVVPWN